MGDADAKETSFVRELGDARTMLEERRNECAGALLTPADGVGPRNGLIKRAIASRSLRTSIPS